MDLYSSAQAAAKSGISPRTIARLAARHGIGRKIGKTWTFTAADLARLRKAKSPHAGPGNPTWVK